MACSSAGDRGAGNIHIVCKWKGGCLPVLQLGSRQSRPFGAGGKTQGAPYGQGYLFSAAVLELPLLPAVLPRLHPEQRSWCGKSGQHLYAALRDQQLSAVQ